MQLGSEVGTRLPFLQHHMFFHYIPTVLQRKKNQQISLPAFLRQSDVKMIHSWACLPYFMLLKTFSALFSYFKFNLTTGVDKLPIANWKGYNLRDIPKSKVQLIAFLKDKKYCSFDLFEAVSISLKQEPE